MDVTELPDAVTTLADVPDEWKVLYVQTPDGFSINPKFLPQILQGRSDILQARNAHAEKVREKDAQIADLEAGIERLRNENQTFAASTAIRRALKARGVKDGLRRAAEVVLLKDLKLRFEERESDILVTAESAHGLTSVDHAVTVWLHGQNGAPFLPPPPKGPGKFTSEIHRLRLVN
jgi:hypothetical protein